MKDQPAGKEAPKTAEEIPEVIRAKISYMANYYANVKGFAGEYRYDAKRFIDYGTGAIDGYKLASKQVEEATDKDKEIERLKGLVDEMIAEIIILQDAWTNLKRKYGV